MNYIVVFTICSALYGTCLQPVQHPELFKSHYECTQEGYGIASAMITEMGQDRVNSDRIVVGFRCEPKMDI